uniref:DUF4346 domain-containing protein n=1 Tax=Cliftonaea pectinata TaxID=2007206 RepID=A0A1Z1MQU1_9FLOR|nr:hypothetical protein [Cliftonaea pectinata]ARW68135.1 hypothetical protein [Cliftonaea pectinata]
MDRNYFIICASSKNLIELHYFKYDITKILRSCRYPTCFTANSSSIIFYLMSLHSSCNVLSTQHKLYLGKEIFKLEISIKLNQLYIQN